MPRKPKPPMQVRTYTLHTPSGVLETFDASTLEWAICVAEDCLRHRAAIEDWFLTVDGVEVYRAQNRA